MSDPVKRAWRFYLDDMISFAEKVIAYTNSKTKHWPIKFVKLDRPVHYESSE